MADTPDRIEDAPAQAEPCAACERQGADVEVRVRTSTSTDTDHAHRRCLSGFLHTLGRIAGEHEEKEAAAFLDGYSTKERRGEAERAPLADAATERAEADAIERAAVDLLHSISEYVRQSMDQNPEWSRGARAVEEALLARRRRRGTVHPAPPRRRVAAKGATHCDGFGSDGDGCALEPGHALLCVGYWEAVEHEGDFEWPSPTALAAR